MAKTKTSKKTLKKPIKARVIKYTPNRKGKAIAKRKSGPVARFFRKPATKISIGALACGLGAFFVISNNIVPSLESIQESVVQIEACNEIEYNCSSGSGFAAFERNYIITNYHVIAGADTIKIKTITGVEGKATRIIAFDPENDIAILEWDNKLNMIKIGSSDNAKVGDKVLAIGNPLGETNVVSEGIISNKTSEYGLMTTAAISPGSSGGALILDTNHRVIGVTYLKNIDGESMNYAIKIEDVKKVIDAYKKGDIFTINSEITGSCYTTLSKIAEDAANLPFTGCTDSSTSIYATTSLVVFYDVTNDRIRFEHALSERSDWKEMYDRLGETTKNNLVYNLDNTKSALFDTNWKYIIWFANENFYYSCTTDYCKYYRYIYGFYPTSYNGEDFDPAGLEEL